MKKVRGVLHGNGKTSIRSNRCGWTLTTSRATRLHKLVLQRLWRIFYAIQDSHRHRLLSRRGMACTCIGHLTRHLYWPNGFHWLSPSNGCANNRDCQPTMLVRLTPQESLDPRLRGTGKISTTPSPWPSLEALEEHLQLPIFFAHYPKVDTEMIQEQVTLSYLRTLHEQQVAVLTGEPSTLKSANVNRM